MAPIIKNRLGEILKETGVSQRRLADAIDVRPNTITDLVKNERKKPDLEILARIMQYFGITDVGQILIWVDDEENSNEAGA